MGLKSWKGSRVRQQDVVIAKNYLNKTEIKELNRIVVMYLDYAEDQAKRRKTMTMRDWEEKLDAFLSFNERDILNIAEQLALERYIEFDTQRHANEKTSAEIEEKIILEELEIIIKEQNLIDKRT